MTLSVSAFVQDRFCGAVHLTASPIEFPSFVLSVLDADIAGLQQGVSGAAAVPVGDHHTEPSCAVLPHVCNGCAPPLACTVDAATGVLQECAASHASLAVERVHSMQGPQASAAEQDSAKQRMQVLHAAATASEAPATDASHRTSWSQPSPDRYSVGQPVAGDMQGRSHTFVADHDSSTKFDIMEWFISSRSSVPPPRLPKCMPFIDTQSGRMRTQDGFKLGSAKDVYGSARLSEKYGQQHAAKGWSASIKATHADHEVSSHSRGTGYIGFAPLGSLDSLPMERALNMHCMQGVSSPSGVDAWTSAHHVADRAKQTTNKQTKGRTRKCVSKSRARVKAGAAEGGRKLWEGAVARQGQVGKRRGGRLERELAESDAADRGGMVELGFNAHLKQFEKSQREKGIFKNRQKARPSVYTVSGIPQQD